MAKGRVYEVKDYGSGWDAAAISNDMTARASQGWDVLHVVSMPQSYEVSRYPDETPGLNDGDSVTFHSTTRVVFVK